MGAGLGTRPDEAEWPWRGGPQGPQPGDAPGSSETPASCWKAGEACGLAGDRGRPLATQRSSEPEGEGPLQEERGLAGTRPHAAWPSLGTSAPAEGGGSPA